ncbi:Heavy metal-associated isoprenylated plant protein 20 [Linum perenne]
MGALDSVSDYLSELFRVAKNKRKRKQMQTIEIKVKMDCVGCERKVKNSVSHMKGVKSVELIRKQSRLTVKGYVEPKKVLKRVQNTRKKAEFWPYVQYNLVSYPYVSGAYDKKAPSDYVRNVPQALPISDDTAQTLTSIFSDDNPNVCYVM